MLRILLVTVGGSFQPIVTAITTLQPDRVVFLCSTGSRGSISQVTGAGTPCELRGKETSEKFPNIPTQVGLGDRFHPDRDVVEIQNPDDLSECYSLATQTIRQLNRDVPDAQLIADYTGGTKTMSLALAMAALDNNVGLYLTTSTTRANLIRVERGEATERAPTALVNVERKINQFLPLFLQQYNYPAAVAELQQILTATELPIGTKRMVREFRDCCSGLDAWDRFDHVEAWDYLRPYMKIKQIQPLGLFLKRVISSRAQIDQQFSVPDGTGTDCHGYEIVQDLLLNAERRSMQARYDDAVGRLYRGLELLVQIRLKQAYGIETGNVDPEKLPESIRQKYLEDAATRSRDQRIILPLTRSYVLLSEMLDDPLGKIYQARGEQVQGMLQVRNYSLFAHGFQPISKTRYQEFSGAIADFIKTGIAAILPAKFGPEPVQFPQALDLVGSRD